jgi:hypothetical protein
MPKSRKASPVAQGGVDTQKLCANAYGARLARQVADELDSSRRTGKPRKKAKV